MNTRRRRSSPTSSSSAASRSGTAISCRASSSRPNSWCLRSRSLLRRQRSIARCFAVAMSQAPGLSGMPEAGHCSRAATRASCASSSARPTSRTIRVRPAMILADSILQTASMAECVGVDVTATHHTTFKSFAQAERFVPRIHHLFLDVSLRFGAAKVFVTKGFRPDHLANLGLALPAGPVFLVQLHEAQRSLDRLLLRLQLKLRVATDNLLGLGERSVGDSDLPTGKPDTGSHRGWAESTGAEHRAGFDRLFAELVNGVH